MELLISLLIVLVYSWLTFKVATSVPGRIRQFSLRSLLLWMAVASVFIAAFAQMGLVGIFFLLVTLLAGGVGLVVGIRR